MWDSANVFQFFLLFQERWALGTSLQGIKSHNSDEHKKKNLINKKKKKKTKRKVPRVAIVARLTGFWHLRRAWKIICFDRRPLVAGATTSRHLSLYYYDYCSRCDILARFNSTAPSFLPSKKKKDFFLKIVSFFSAVRDPEIVDRFMSGCHFW